MTDKLWPGWFVGRIVNCKHPYAYAFIKKKTIYPLEGGVPEGLVINGDLFIHIRHSNFEGRLPPDGTQIMFRLVRSGTAKRRVVHASLYQP
jgi:hypothetical protein